MTHTKLPVLVVTNQYVETLRRRSAPRAITQLAVADQGPSASEVSNTPYYPKRPTRGELAKVGVEIYNPQNWSLRCKQCGMIWSPNILRGGRQPRGYWRCPNGCNS
jgi:hypothetical protein